MRNAQITKMSLCPPPLREEFGPDVFDPQTGELDRAALRGIIFEDEEQRRKLNRITHPEIYKEMSWAAVKYALSGHQYVVLDLPLLFETGTSLRLAVLALFQSPCRPRSHGELHAQNHRGHV